MTARAGAAKRRDDVFVSCLQHERMTVAMHLAEVRHHSAGPLKFEKVVERCVEEDAAMHNALRGQKKPLSGKPPPICDVTQAAPLPRLLERDEVLVPIAVSQIVQDEVAVPCLPSGSGAGGRRRRRKHERLVLLATSRTHGVREGMYRQSLAAHWSGIDLLKG